MLNQAKEFLDKRENIFQWVMIKKKSEGTRDSELISRGLAYERHIQKVNINRRNSTQFMPY